MVGHYRRIALVFMGSEQSWHWQWLMVLTLEQRALPLGYTALAVC